MVKGDADNIAAEEDDNSVKKVSIAAQSTTSIETVSENSSSKKRALRDRPGMKKYLLMFVTFRAPDFMCEMFFQMQFQRS